MLDEPHGPKRFLATAMPLSVSTRTSHISLGSRIPKSLVPVGFVQEVSRKSWLG